MTSTIDPTLKGGRLTLSKEEGVRPMGVYEALSLMLTFGMLIVSILSFPKRK
jgi:hypothetical protein